MADPTKLLARLQAKQARSLKGRHSAVDWDGKTYGHGAGKAHPCVEFVTCPLCGARPGKLCVGPTGPKFDRHYLRANAYQELLAQARTKLTGRRHYARGRRPSWGMLPIDPSKSGG